MLALDFCSLGQEAVSLRETGKQWKTYYEKCQHKKDNECQQI